MPTAFLACCLIFAGGCAARTVYLAGGERVYRLEAGQPAPIAGWLMSDEALAELYEALDRKLPAPGQAALPEASPPANSDPRPDADASDGAGPAAPAIPAP